MSKIAVAALALFFSIFAYEGSAHATAVLDANPGDSHECSGQMGLPALACHNLKGGADWQVYLIEYQICNQGHVTDAKRSLRVLHTVDATNGQQQVHSIDDANVQVQLSTTRTHFDKKPAGDDASMVLPLSLTAKDGPLTFNVIFDSALSADSGTASGYQLRGKFTEADANKAVTATDDYTCTLIVN